MRERWRAACVMVAALLVAASACRLREEVPHPSAGDKTAAPPRATVTPPGPAATLGSLTVAVERVQRLSRDLIQIDLSALNTGTAAVDLGQVMSSEAGGLEQATLTAGSGNSRTFVLRDGDGKAQCSGDLGALSPGSRRTVFVRFLAFSGGEFRGTLEIPGLSPLFPVAVPAAQP